MRVKVGDTIYDGEKEPVMIILTPKEKKLMIKHLIKTDALKYCVYPRTDNWNENDFIKIKKWMGIE